MEFSKRVEWIGSVELWGGVGAGGADTVMVLVHRWWCGRLRGREQAEEVGCGGVVRKGMGR